MAANVGDEFRPGATVPRSGIYKVVHDPARAQAHEVTCVHGKIFPPCRGCDHPRFVLGRAAQHIDSNEHFKGA
jgi:hypothetical protein